MSSSIDRIRNELLDLAEEIRRLDLEIAAATEQSSNLKRELASARLVSSTLRFSGLGKRRQFEELPEQEKEQKITPEQAAAIQARRIFVPSRTRSDVSKQMSHPREMWDSIDRYVESAPPGGCGPRRVYTQNQLADVKVQDAIFDRAMCALEAKGQLNRRNSSRYVKLLVASDRCTDPDSRPTWFEERDARFSPKTAEAVEDLGHVIDYIRRRPIEYCRERSDTFAKQV